MTEIEKQALALVNEVAWERSCWPIPEHLFVRRDAVKEEALCRAIERHEAFKQEVSDAVEEFRDQLHLSHRRDAFASLFGSFIISKPDPLVEALRECLSSDECMIEPADRLRKALAVRGLEIVEKKP